MSLVKDLEQYAELAVKVGVNIQKDQTLWINGPLKNIHYGGLERSRK